MNSKEKASIENLLDEKIKNLNEQEKVYGSYYKIHSDIKKTKKKIKNNKSKKENSELIDHLKIQEAHLEIITSAEKEIFKIQNLLKKKMISKNEIKKRYELKVNKQRRIDYDIKKYIKIINNQPYKEDKIEKLIINIEELERKLIISPKNLAIKVDLFDKKRKLHSITKVYSVAYFKNLDKLNDKHYDKIRKIKDLNEKVDFYKKELSEYKIIYDKTIAALTEFGEPINKKSFVIQNLNVYYGKRQALFDISIEIPKNKVISIIGPSGCGKSTFLRTLNRINDEITNFRARGKILLDGEYDIYKLKSIRNNFDKIELTELRTKVGMIFQQPNPFPISIFKNVAYGPKINGYKNKALLNNIVKNSLIKAALWDEVKDNIHRIGTSLSGGQQQRLCIARAIANKPEILLMDEPTSALDPIAASKIESLILELKKDYTIIMVTHSLQQAARISDFTAFFYGGKIIEFSETKKLFSSPDKKRTDDYIRGRFG
ncbi:MAG: hypothetical protein HPAVJP_2050 [Candidatus Hepatoplasma vulgare]|nr:MAG: hypothetical protein HPAVJP_2050 [Candidatus Hepatoplasma sp.]